MSVVEGDCVEVMAGMEPESVDAVVTDPPYDLTSTGARNGSPRNPGTGPYSRGFMGKAWDGTGVAFRPETWAECFRVAKPSAYLLAFGGTRTVHRMTTAIEDAGWIIRDMLVWAYASGFPKSKASLKPAWEPIVMARKPGPLRMLAIDACRIPFVSTLDAAAAAAAAAAVGYSRSMELGTMAEPTSLPKVYDKPPYDPDAIAGRWPANVILTDPIFDGDTPGVVGGGEQSAATGPFTRADIGYGGGSNGGDGMSYGDAGTYSRFFLIPKADRTDREPVLRTDRERIFGDGLSTETKSANPTARHNVHPTVKPTDLMRHLVRFVTPQDGIVLDPFLGSGTTALACELEGFRWLGIEKEPEYVAIARARLLGTQRGLGLVG